MSNAFWGLPKTILVASLCVASAATFGARARQPRNLPDAIPSQLLSDDERIEFCTRMHRASRLEERQAVVERMRDTLIPRAKAQDVALPTWLLSGRTMKALGGPGKGVPGLGCESGVAKPRAQASAPAHAVPDRKMATHEVPVREMPLQGLPRSDIPVGYDRGIAYVTGGVGQDEATALRGLASGYSMRATFTASSGEYLSGVAVQVSKFDGTVVFTATSEGPYLFARLPPGHYRLIAEFNGLKRTRTLDVPTRGGVRFTLVWPAARAAEPAHLDGFYAQPGARDL
jgi:hypothetical protein